MFVFRDHESSKRIDGSLSPSKTLLGIPTHRQLFYGSCAPFQVIGVSIWNGLSGWMGLWSFCHVLFWSTILFLKTVLERYRFHKILKFQVSGHKWEMRLLNRIGARDLPRKVPVGDQLMSYFNSTECWITFKCILTAQTMSSPMVWVVSCITESGLVKLGSASATLCRKGVQKL